MSHRIPEETVSASPPGQPPRMLIIQSECSELRSMEPVLSGAAPSLLDRLGRNLLAMRPRAVWSDGDGFGTPDIMRVRSLAELHAADLAAVDLVISDSHLGSASAFDVIAFLRGVRPDVTLVMLGLVEDAEIAAEAIRAGASDFLAMADGTLSTLPVLLEKAIAHQRVRAENERLHRELSRSLVELAIKNRQLETMIERLEHTARTDELTQLSNRRWLGMMLDGAWAESARHGFPLAFLMLDLDGFKAINDRVGHQRGDEILAMTARVIRANCREIDCVARYGGDEFCVLMPHTRATEAAAAARRILDEVGHMVRCLPPAERGLGVSVGVAQVELSEPADVESLVRHADEALYAAKSSGRGRVMLRGRRDTFLGLDDLASHEPMPVSRLKPSA